VRVSFGRFSLDTESRQLFEDGVERHLSPKAFQLLVLLLECRPKAISKAELHEHLWPDTFVSDATVTSLVAEVRGALRERAGRGRFIRTVHRFGYAFKDLAPGRPPRTVAVDGRARCWIVWEHGQVGLPEGDHLLGRDDDVAVWLESPTVSRHHARISIAGGDARLEDLESKNGTYVRGERLAAAVSLRDGDAIRLGSVTLTFRALAGSPSTETQRTGDLRSGRAQD
jgi:hypothetical protein